MRKRNIEHITAVLITKNASATIYQTISKLRAFKEIIVLDTGSNDATIPIAKQFANVRVYRSGFSGFGDAKNRAASFATNDWILSIDADEVMSLQLLDSIISERLDNKTVYKFRRVNYYKNKQIKHSGWGKEYVTRLYNRKHTSFNGKLVHEGVEEKSMKIKKIAGVLHHYSYSSIYDFGIKREFYSELFAFEYRGKVKSSPFKAFYKSAFDFFNTFFIRLGILDGYRGLLIAVSNAHVTFMKYLKLYEANLDYNNINKNKMSSNMSVKQIVNKVEKNTNTYKPKLSEAMKKVNVDDIDSLRINLTILN